GANPDDGGAAGRPAAAAASMSRRRGISCAGVADAGMLGRVDGLEGAGALGEAAAGPAGGRGRGTPRRDWGAVAFGFGGGGESATSAKCTRGSRGAGSARGAGAASADSMRPVEKEDRAHDVGPGSARAGAALAERTGAVRRLRTQGSHPPAAAPRRTSDTWTRCGMKRPKEGPRK